MGKRARQIIQIINRPKLEALAREIRTRAGKFRKELADFFRKQLGPETARFIRDTQFRGDPVRSRTGRLARAIEGTGFEERLTAVMEVGLINVTDERLLAYGAAMEHGAVIEPQNAESLAMPYGENMGPDLAAVRPTSSFGPGELRTIKFGSPRGRRNNVIGRLVLEADWQREREEAIAEDRPMNQFAIEPLFLLLLFVQLEPRNYLARGIREFMPTILQRTLNFVEEQDLFAKSEMILKASKKIESELETGPFD